MNNKTKTITISTHLGDVVGVKESNGSYFKGIPYGADTSGKNRWRSPQEPESWTEAFDASSFFIPLIVISPWNACMNWYVFLK